jgi:protein-tyrosine phosphatase
MNTLLFLCTGNYYRSRFAELVFNALAATQRLNWQAISRGLALERGVNNTGPISRTVLDTLSALGIDGQTGLREPLQVQEHEFAEAQLIIALQEAEHRPLLAERYPAWVEHVVYWHVRDVRPSPDYNPLQEIEQEVRRLLPRLAQPDAPGPQGRREHRP